MAMGRFPKLYLVTAVVIAAVLGGAVHNELQGPNIRAVPLASADPFALRFAVFNPAFLVSLKSVDMICKPLSVQGHGADRHAWTAEAKPFPLDVDIDLGPRMTFEYTCPIKSDGTKGPPDKVEAQVAIQYSRFGRRTQAMSGTLAWDSLSRVWTDAGR